MAGSRSTTFTTFHFDLVENAIRPTALGRKNWLFVGEAEAGEGAAIIYTVIETCRRRGIDPYAYLKDVLTRLPRMTNHQVPEVTPAAWAKPIRKFNGRPYHNSHSYEIYQSFPLFLSRGFWRDAYAGFSNSRNKAAAKGT